MHRSHGQAQRSDVLGNPLRDMAVVFREYVVKRVLGSKRYSNWLAFRVSRHGLSLYPASHTVREKTTSHHPHSLYKLCWGAEPSKHGAVKMG